MVIVRIWEGLGNQMFQYAYARALKEKGIDVRLDLDKAYDDVFVKYRNNALRNNGIQNFRISVPKVDVYKYGKYTYLNQDTVIQKGIYWLGSHFMWKYKFYEEQEPYYSEEKVRIGGSCYVKGWFQDERYFRNIRPILLKEFVPQKKIKISQEIKIALQDMESVSVHVRRGDYVKLNISLNPLYYEKAIYSMKQIYQNPIFLVFSDDLKWVKQNLHINGRYIYVNEDGELQDYEELFVMSRCRSNIIANSTYSWWAAWLNQTQEKVVIAPKKWGKNIAPDEWRLI